MTMPGFQVITPLKEITYQGLQISGTLQGAEIGAAIETAFKAGTVTYGAPEMTTLPNGEAGWRIKITMGQMDYFVYQGDWIVMDSEDRLSVWHGTSPWPSNNPQIAAKFTTNVPVVWAATTVAPIAVALPGMMATIKFPCPCSANSPFTYTVSGSDMTASSTADVEVSGDPVVADGYVTLTVTGLIEEHEYSFAVTVHTDYEGVTATSALTAPISALTAPPAS
jgi:hypothetical protein